MVQDHPLAYWLGLEVENKDDENVLSLLNEKQMQHLESWIMHQLFHAKTWGNA